MSNYKKGPIVIKFEVYTNFDLTDEEIANQLLDAEQSMNFGSKLRFHMKSVTEHQINELCVKTVGKEGHTQQKLSGLTS